MGKHNRKKLERKSKPSRSKDKVYLKYQKDQNCPSKLKELLSNSESQTKKRKKEKKSSVFKQIPGETDFQFLRRMNQEVDYVVKATRAMPDEQPEIENDKATKAQKQKQKRRLYDKKLVKKTKAQDRLMDALEKEVWKEDIKFGDVVTQPPVFKSKPRKAEAIKSDQNKMNFSFLSKFSTDGSSFKLKS